MSKLRLTTYLISAAALAFIAAGCASGGPTNVEVLPIEPILSSEIVITPDASATTANLVVDTNIPVSCAVIYGTDDSFGQIAVDSDMQGGAHEDHGPLLTGLIPDTDYVYVLQGSDANGNIYRSETLSFRTPPATESALGTNIAPTGTATASSEFSDGFAAQAAIDGNPGTEWSTAGDGDDAWIEVELPEEQAIASVAFRTRQMNDGTAITETFTVTIDGTVLGPFPAGDAEAVFETAVTGSVLRFDAEQTTGGNTGATEIEIYAG